jgi:hypothetical protein
VINAEGCHADSDGILDEMIREVSSETGRQIDEDVVITLHLQQLCGHETTSRSVP